MSQIINNDYERLINCVTTYLRYRPEEKHSIVATRFKLMEIDKRLQSAGKYDL